MSQEVNNLEVREKMNDFKCDGMDSTTESTNISELKDSARVSLADSTER